MVKVKTTCFSFQRGLSEFFTPKNSLNLLFFSNFSFLPRKMISEKEMSRERALNFTTLFKIEYFKTAKIP